MPISAEPPGFKELKAQPEAAFYHRDLGEFILPYDSVRTARSPEASIRAFVESTYEAAADLAGWDRKALERALVPLEFLNSDAAADGAVRRRRLQLSERRPQSSTASRFRLTLANRRLVGRSGAGKARSSNS